MANCDFLVEKLQHGSLILDGAIGTWLQGNGLPSGISPDIWVLQHPDILQHLQYSYMEAGSDVIYAFTFGASRIKLADNKIPADQTIEINRRLARISCEVRADFCRQNSSRQVLVAGDLAPTGRFLYPAGDLSFDELITVYQEQVEGLLQEEIDLFVIETMMDLAQVRAAVLAIRNLSDLPIMVTMTLEGNGRTLSGNSPTECLLTCADMGVCAFGLNCSQGPSIMKKWLEPLPAISPIPLIAKPNAGIPELINGHTVFKMSDEEFAQEMLELARAGIMILGGCCGTSPDHIAQLKKNLDRNPVCRSPGFLQELPPAICSARRTWFVDKHILPLLPVVSFSSADSLVDDIMDTDPADAPALIINFETAAVTMSGAEISAVCAALQELQGFIDIPLIFQSDNTSLLESLLDSYHGRAGVLSDFITTKKGLSL